MFSFSRLLFQAQKVQPNSDAFDKQEPFVQRRVLVPVKSSQLALSHRAHQRATGLVLGERGGSVLELLVWLQRGSSR